MAGPVELEKRGPAVPSLGVHRLHGDRHNELHRAGAGRRNAAAMGDLFAAAPARLTPFHWSVFVRAAVCHPVAQGEESMTVRPARGRPERSRGMNKRAATEGRSASALISKRI